MDWFRSLIGGSNPGNKFSLNKFDALYQDLHRNRVVTSENAPRVIELIRSLSELLIWGDQHNEKFFDFFLEKDMMTLLREILQQKTENSVKRQLIQTLCILVQNLERETSLFYLFSNNNINRIITNEFDFADDEIVSYYITLLKTLSLRLNERTIHFFYNKRSEGFPLYSQAITFFQHPERMIQTAVRTIALNVFRIPDDDVHQFVVSSSVSVFFPEIVALLRALFFRVYNSLNNSRDSQNEMEEIIDLLYFMSDIFRTRVSCIESLLARRMLDRFFYPVLFFYLRDLRGPSPMDDSESETSASGTAGSSSSTLLSEDEKLLSLSLMLGALIFSVFECPVFINHLFTILLGRGFEQLPTIREPRSEKADLRRKAHVRGAKLDDNASADGSNESIDGEKAIATGVDGDNIQQSSKSKTSDSANHFVSSEGQHTNLLFGGSDGKDQNDELENIEDFVDRTDEPSRMDSVHQNQSSGNIHHRSPRSSRYEMSSLHAGNSVMTESFETTLPSNRDSLQTRSLEHPFLSPPKREVQSVSSSQPSDSPLYRRASSSVPSSACDSSSSTASVLRTASFVVQRPVTDFADIEKLRISAPQTLNNNVRDVSEYSDSVQEKVSSPSPRHGDSVLFAPSYASESTLPRCNLRVKMNALLRCGHEHVVLVCSLLLLSMFKNPVIDRKVLEETDCVPYRLYRTRRLLGDLFNADHQEVDDFHSRSSSSSPSAQSEPDSSESPQKRSDSMTGYPSKAIDITSINERLRIARDVHRGETGSAPMSNCVWEDHSRGKRDILQRHLSADLSDHDLFSTGGISLRSSGSRNNRSSKPSLFPESNENSPSSSNPKLPMEDSTPNIDADPLFELSSARYSASECQSASKQSALSSSDIDQSAVYPCLDPFLTNQTPVALVSSIIPHFHISAEDFDLCSMENFGSVCLRVQIEAQASASGHSSCAHPVSKKILQFEPSIDLPNMSVSCADLAVKFPVKEYPTDLVESLLEALSAPTSRPVTVICLSKLLLELASSIGSRNVFHFRHFEILMELHDSYGSVVRKYFDSDIADGVIDSFESIYREFDRAWMMKAERLAGDISFIFPSVRHSLSRDKPAWQRAPFTKPDLITHAWMNYLSIRRALLTLLELEDEILESPFHDSYLRRQSKLERVAGPRVLRCLCIVGTRRYPMYLDFDDDLVYALQPHPERANVGRVESIAMTSKLELSIEPKLPFSFRLQETANHDSVDSFNFLLQFENYELDRRAFEIVHDSIRIGRLRKRSFLENWVNAETVREVFLETGKSGKSDSIR